MALERSQIPDAGKWTQMVPKLSEQTLNTLEKLGFCEMTPVQASTIPLFLKNKDVVVEAVTGSGKTLAFLIPILEIIRKREEPLRKHQIGAIVISPTRELARQIWVVLDDFLADFNLNQAKDISSGSVDAFKPLTKILLTGGHDVKQDMDDYRENGGNIVIATPGKLEEILKNTEFNTKQLEVLVLDEADRLLDMGFEQSLRNIISKLPKQRRTALFSATMTEGLSELARAGLRNPVKVIVKVEDLETRQVQRIPSSLRIRYILCEPHEKVLQLLAALIERKDKKTILYYNTCMSVDYFSRIFSHLPILKGIPIISLHGKMVEKKRISVFDQFQKSSNGVLICTDVAARGLDVPDIDCVIQYDPPQDPQSFLHRCGRTARQGRRGEAFIFLHHHEDTYVDFLRLRKIPLDEAEQFDVSSVTSAKFAPVSISGAIYLPHVNDSHNEDAKSRQKRIISLKNPNLVEFVHSLILNDRDLYLKSIQAFVSFLRSYKEHQLKYIFNITKLDLKQILSSFFLLHRPKCPELKTIKIEIVDAKYGQSAELGLFVNCIKDSDVELIKFKDKTRQKQRVEQIKKRELSKDVDLKKGAKKPEKRISESWSNHKDRMEIKKNRKEKKEKKKEAIKLANVKSVQDQLESKRQLEEEEWNELQEETRKMKKSKQQLE